MKYKYPLLVLMSIFPLTACNNDISLQCTDKCIAAEHKCVDETSYMLCDNYDSDPCLEFPDEPTSCPAGTLCRDGYCIDPNNQCTRGEKRCSTEVNGVQTCRFVNTVLTWGAAELCQAGSYCRNGKCDSCRDVCERNSLRCNQDNSAYEICKFNEESGCLQWTKGSNCIGDQICRGGHCAPPDEECRPDCLAGQKICVDDGYRECGDFDGDDCLDWGPVHECEYGYSCSDGNCLPAGQCYDECSYENQRECFLEGFRVCHNIDSDPCLEWTYGQCPLDQSCSNGNCAPLSACVDECDGENVCSIDGLSYIPCGKFDKDSCWDLGIPQLCPDNFICDDDLGQCTCSCDYEEDVCEPADFQSAEDCACDDDCLTKKKCAVDGFCDPWCIPGSDPDCSGECECDYMPGICDAGCDFAESSGCPVPSRTNLDCYCDPDCVFGLHACIRDGYVDEWCPATGSLVDQDVGKKVCDNYTIEVATLPADSDIIHKDGVVDSPDKANGAGWIQIGPTVLKSGSIQFTLSFSSENRQCMGSVKLSVYGYDSCACGFGPEGSVVSFYNYKTYIYDNMPNSITNELQWTNFSTTELDKYLKCDNSYCTIDVRIYSDNCQCSHINTIKYSIKMTK